MDAVAKTCIEFTDRLNYPMFIVTTAVGERREGSDRLRHADELPILDGCPSWFVGTIDSRHDLGDHEGYLLEPVDERCEPAELLYFQDVNDIEPGQAA